ncbi:MAG: hypothetical protein H6681_02655 [Desulfobacteraceae bacterium]|nr:hypothetical protein [Desulfobacteraceae bacterium]MCB9494328.1 hypothetical protein [Desulfobacteraceae bacterium]
MLTTIICSGISSGEKKILETALKYKIETRGYTTEKSGLNTEKFCLETVDSEKDADFKNAELADGIICLSQTAFLESDSLIDLKNYCLLNNIHFYFQDITSGSIHEISDRIGSFVFENGISSLMFKTDDSIRSGKADLIQAVFESLVYILLMKTNPEALASPIHVKAPDNSSSSASVESVVDDLLETVPLKDRVIISNMSEHELPDVLLVMGITILSKYYWPKNNLLLDDCVKISGRQNLEEFEIAEIIIKMFWKKLKKTHRIRLVK